MSSVFGPVAGDTAAAVASRDRTVLVVDDIPEITGYFEGLVHRLRGLHVHLTTETDSSKALDVVHNVAFDLIVTDYRMKDVDGVDILTASRALNPVGRRVLMTGYNEIPTPVSRLRAADIDVYLQKPLKAQELLILIGDLLQEKPDSLQELRRHARELEYMAQCEEDAAAQSFASLT